ncbi:MAG: ion transporter [Saprospiraceae bacterium]
MPLKQKIHHLINESKKEKHPANKAIKLFIISLIILSTIQIILESYEDINQQYHRHFEFFEVITVIVFTMEYLLRIWTADLRYPELTQAKARKKFIFSTFGVIDLLAILPFYLPFFFKFDLRFVRILRVVRLLRILKLSRYNQSLKLVIDVFKEKSYDLGITFLVTAILILMSSALMYNVEHDVQPDKFPNIVETFWWSIATLTTIGYGDVYPVTGWGKLLSGIIAMLGIGLVALPTGILSSGFIDKVQSKPRRKSKKIDCCPNCGFNLSDK